MKKVISSSIVIIIILMFLMSPIYGAESDEIKVFLNDERLKFDVEPIIYKDRTMVPMRQIFEKYGMNIKWNNNNRTVISYNESTQIKLKINDNKVYVNGKLITLDSEPIIRSDRTLVPLRFISELLDMTVSWDHVNRSVYINNFDIESFNQKNLVMKNIQSNKSFEIGQSLEELHNNFGTPERVDKDIYGSIWYIYNAESNNYNGYIKFRIFDNKVVEAEFANPEWSINGLRTDIEYNDDIKNIINNINSKGHIDIKVYTDKKNNIQILNIHDSNTIKFTISYYNDEEMKELKDDKILDGYSNQLFDLSNIYRIKNYKKKLIKNTALQNMTYAHTLDMANNNIFSHNSSNGDSFNDRFKNMARKNRWKKGGENIAAGVYPPSHIVNRIVNSEKHEENLLGDYDYMSVSTVFNKNSDYGLYFTQNFVK